LKLPCGSEAHFNFEINFCPNKVIASITTESPNTYATRFNIPVKKLAGRMIPRIIPYVGLQLENTGHSDIPTSILHFTHVLLADFASPALAFPENLPEIFFQTLGNNVIIPKKNIITPEATFK
jgi:hypothetical protein